MNDLWMALDASAAFSRQLVTTATLAIFALSVVLARRLSDIEKPRSHRLPLAAYVAFFISIAAGFWHQHVLTRVSLSRDPLLAFQCTSARLSSWLQVGFLILATILLVWFVLQSLSSRSKSLSGEEER